MKILNEKCGVSSKSTELCFYQSLPTVPVALHDQSSNNDERPKQKRLVRLVKTAQDGQSNQLYPLLLRYFPLYTIYTMRIGIMLLSNKYWVFRFEFCLQVHNVVQRNVPLTWFIQLLACLFSCRTCSRSKDINSLYIIFKLTN